MSKSPVETSRGVSRRRLAGTIAAIVSIVAVLAGCAAPAPEPEPTPTAVPLEPRDLTMTIGTLLPQTGTLAQFGPATQAAVALAVNDVNEAAQGVTVSVEYRDSADSTSDVGLSSTAELLGLDVSAIVGAVSSGVSKRVIDQIVAAGVVQISPSNASPDFTAYADDGLYWRTSPSCVLEGDALATQAATNGATTLGVLTQTEQCGAGLATTLTAAFQREGGEVSISRTFDTTTTALDVGIADIVAQRPDAVAILSGPNATRAAAGFLAAGYTGDELYFVGPSVEQLPADFPVAELTGATAAAAGLQLSSLADFTTRLLEFDPGITEFDYAAETYDAVVLLALAALAANSTDGTAIAERLQAVSGGSGAGRKATDFAAAASILLAGEAVDYDGVSGEISFDGNGDPRGAVIGRYELGADGAFARLG